MTSNSNVEKLSMELLKEVAKIAKGKTFQNIPISSITDIINLNDYPDYHNEIIVDSIELLKKKGYLLPGIRMNEVKITWEGINYILRLPNINPSNFGMLSNKEFEKLIPYVKSTILNLGKNQTHIISFSDLKIALESIYEGPIYQYLEFLRKEGVIEFLDDNITNILIKVN